MNPVLLFTMLWLGCILVYNLFRWFSGLLNSPNKQPKRYTGVMYNNRDTEAQEYDPESLECVVTQYLINGKLYRITRTELADGSGTKVDIQEV